MIPVSSQVRPGRVASTRRRNTGPEQQAPYDDFALPHVLTFSGLIGSAWRTYWHGQYDEALQHSRQDALVMRNDCFLMSLLQERKLAAASRPWCLEIDSEKDPHQVRCRDLVTAALRSTPRWRRLLMSLLEAIWYGRAGVQLLWEWRQVSGQRALGVRDWMPINGDKIGHTYDGVPYVLVYAGQAEQLGGAEVIQATIGRALVLRGPWRERFLVHTHEPDDADFFEPAKGDGAFGVGIRSRLFFFDWMRREWLAKLCDWMDRVGLGLTLWYYEEGNPASKAQAEASAEEQSGRVNILWPRNAQGRGGSGVERLEVPVAGATTLVEMQKWICEIQERYVVGQTLSSRPAGAGLGGSEVAEFQADTKGNITDYDTGNLADTLTGSETAPGLVSILKRWICPWADFPLRFSYAVKRAATKDRLSSIQTVWSMGIPVKADEVRAAAELTRPASGDEVIPPPGQPGPREGTDEPGDKEQAPVRTAVSPRRYAAHDVGDEPRDRDGRWTREGAGGSVRKDGAKDGASKDGASKDGASAEEGVARGRPKDRQAERKAERKRKRRERRRLRWQKDRERLRKRRQKGRERGAAILDKRLDALAEGRPAARIVFEHMRPILRAAVLAANQQEARAALKNTMDMKKLKKQLTSFFQNGISKHADLLARVVEEEFPDPRDRKVLFRRIIRLADRASREMASMARFILQEGIRGELKGEDFDRGELLEKINYYLKSSVHPNHPDELAGEAIPMLHNIEEWDDDDLSDIWTDEINTEEAADLMGRELSNHLKGYGLNVPWDEEPNKVWDMAGKQFFDARAKKWKRLHEAIEFVFQDSLKPALAKRPDEKTD